MTATSVQGATPRLSSTKIHCLLNGRGLLERMGAKGKFERCPFTSTRPKNTGSTNKSEIGAKACGQLSSCCGITAIEIPARSKKSSAYGLLDAGKRLFSATDKDAQKLKLVEYGAYANGLQKNVFEVVR